MLLIAFGHFREARQQGVWRWKFFFALLGGSALFIGLVIVPLSRSNVLDTRANLVLALLLAQHPRLHHGSHPRREKALEAVGRQNNSGTP